MLENETITSFLKKMLPRMVKATIKGLLYFVLLYLVPILIVNQLSSLAPDIFANYMQYLTIFAAIVIVSVVASELTAGTIYQHAFNIGKDIVLIVFFILALQGGIISQGFAMGDFRLHFVVDLRIYLAMLIAIDLLGLAKDVLQALNFLSERTELQYPTPGPRE